MKNLIQTKLDNYICKTAEDEENALKEISQEVVLYSLYQSNFFNYAAFQGGTCLRIFHGLDRFSEDLDFCLIKPNSNFEFDKYLSKTNEIMGAFGYQIEVIGKDKADQSIQKRFLKDDSIKKILSFGHLKDLRGKIKIKVEIDINPPQGAITESKTHLFPSPFTVTNYERQSLFAGKCHAILCRNYCKGRDWYDLLWYSMLKISPNFTFLTNALSQQGPWEGQSLTVNLSWLKQELSRKIRNTNWEEAKIDVRKFLGPEKLKSLELWGVDLFEHSISNL